ncbi:MAG: heavy metal-associated domain-containing protein [Deinococcota bacterium]
MNMTVLAVEGMTCKHCQKAVQDALEAVNGTTSAEVSLDDHRAIVQGDADVQKLIDAVTEEGYQASLMS